jgi:hypothetical protein
MLRFARQALRLLADTFQGLQQRIERLSVARGLVEHLPPRKKRSLWGDDKRPPGEETINIR